jgi:hypothetical protein
MNRETAVERMKDYFDDERFSSHTLNVLSHADKLCTGERIEGGFTRSVIELGSIFHDIGIPESQRKYSSIDYTHQEKEGPPVARAIMEEIGIRPDIIERVCYIVAHHHTRQSVDGIDFQIVWEADFLVNIQEGNITIPDGEFTAAVAENIVTDTGRSLAAGLQ